MNDQAVDIAELTSGDPKATSELFQYSRERNDILENLRDLVRDTIKECMILLENASKPEKTMAETMDAYLHEKKAH
jgi:hypothetical protein